MEAALLFLLDKSFRPMKMEQLAEVLQGEQAAVLSSLSALQLNGILECNPMNQTYEVNDSNDKSYRHLTGEKQTFQETVINEVRDTSIIVDAAIVRTLKRRKALPKTELSN